MHLFNIEGKVNIMKKEIILKTCLLSFALFNIPPIINIIGGGSWPFLIFLDMWFINLLYCIICPFYLAYKHQVTWMAIPATSLMFILTMLIFQNEEVIMIYSGCFYFYIIFSIIGTVSGHFIGKMKNK